MAEREAHALSLGDMVADSTRLILEQNNKLGLGVLATLSSEGSENMDEVLAALDLMERMANVSRSLLETRSGAIYKNGANPQSEKARDEGGKLSGDPISEEHPVKLEVVGPKTFGELLDLKIHEFLPADKESYKKKELFNMLKNNNGTRMAVLAAGHDSFKHSFTREEVASIVRIVVTEGRSIARPKEKYDRKQIVASIFPKNRKSLDAYSAVIGQDWGKKPEVDELVFKAIRGIVQLDKLIVKRSATLQEPSTGLD